MRILLVVAVSVDRVALSATQPTPAMREFVSPHGPDDMASSGT
jgi:hypothetical protein